MRDIVIVGIAGSLRPGSYTRMAVRAALRGAEAVGARTRLLDLREFELPFCSGDDAGTEHPLCVYRLRDVVRQADGLILGTPEYHGSFSGALKNALDLMGFEEFEGKIVGLVGVSAGAGGALEGLSGLRAVCRALHAWVTPEQAAIPRAADVFDAAGEPVTAKLAGRLRAVGAQTARFALAQVLGGGEEEVRSMVVS